MLGVVGPEKCEYPTKAVRVIVASGAGGPSDIQSLLLAQKLSESLKQKFVVENRPGAGGTISYGVAAKAAPDGYTLLSVVPTLTFSPALHKNLSFDPIKDFAPISLVARAPYVVAVHPSLPVKTLRELITLARAKPDALAMGQTNGSPNHLAVDAAPAYLNAHPALRSPKDLLGHRIIGSRASDAIHWRFESATGNRNLRLRPRLAVTSNDAAVELSTRAARCASRRLRSAPLRAASPSYR